MQLHFLNPQFLTYSHSSRINWTGLPFPYLAISSSGRTRTDTDITVHGIFLPLSLSFPKLITWTNPKYRISLKLIMPTLWPSYYNGVINPNIASSYQGILILFVVWTCSKPYWNLASCNIIIMRHLEPSTLLHLS